MTTTERKRSVARLRDKLFYSNVEHTSLIELLNKSFPTCPEIIDESTWACPRCDEQFGLTESIEYSFCPYCGQAFDMEAYYSEWNRKYE